MDEAAKQDVFNSGLPSRPAEHHVSAVPIYKRQENEELKEWVSVTITEFSVYLYYHRRGEILSIAIPKNQIDDLDKWKANLWRKKQPDQG